MCCKGEGGQWVVFGMESVNVYFSVYFFNPLFPSVPTVWFDGLGMLPPLKCSK